MEDAPKEETAGQRAGKKEEAAPVGAKPITPAQRQVFWVLTLSCPVFLVAGILIAILFTPPGLKILGPLLLGPGITVLLYGVFYDYSIGPLLAFPPGLSGKIKTAYTYIGALFFLMGFLLWALG